MTIETDRLILREMNENDFEALFDILSDPETMKYYPAPYSSEGVHRWIRWCQDSYARYGFGLWAVTLRENGKMIGDCGISMQNIHGKMLPEIGYHIHKDYQRKGYASEAAAQCMKAAFEKFAFPAVYSYMKYDNVASYGTAQKNGMKFIEEYSDSTNERLRVYGITREEWEKRELEKKRQLIDEACRNVFPAADEPGGEVLVMLGDQVLFEKGYGLSDLVKKTEISGDTFFNIASCSKQFTAVAVLQLAERGKISLRDSVRRYFPEFRSDIWDRVTISQMLSHSSGVPDARDDLTWEQKIHCDDELATEFMVTLDHLNFEPGSCFEYMNPTYTLLGKLIERVSGQPFEDYMREHVFDPAGMKETMYFDPQHQGRIPRMAHGYKLLEQEHQWVKYDYGEETCFATRPDGGIYTSVHEFVLWEKALRSGAVLSIQSLRNAHTPHIRVTGSAYSDYQNRPNTCYGYGWFIEPEKTGVSPEVIYHTGDNGGFKILAVRYPAVEGLILVFANRSDWNRYALKTRLEKIILE